jgi:hypothetical protein
MQPRSDTVERSLLSSFHSNLRVPADANRLLRAVRRVRVQHLRRRGEV